MARPVNLLDAGAPKLQKARARRKRTELSMVRWRQLK